MYEGVPRAACDKISSIVLSVSFAQTPHYKGTAKSNSVVRTNDKVAGINVHECSTLF